MTRKSLILALILFSLSWPSHSQEKFSLEFYAGPSQSFLSYQVIPRNDFISPSNKLRYQFGTTLLWGLKNNWQVTAQLEFFKRELGTYAYSSSLDTIQITGYSKEGIPLLALGMRKSWGNFYLQPSLSLMKSPADLDRYESDRVWNDFPLGVISESDWGVGLRMEGG